MNESPPERKPYIQKKLNLKKFIIICSGIALLLIAIAIFYYFVFFKPQLEKENQSQYKNKLYAAFTIYEECKKGARKTYNMNWKNECQSRGLVPDSSLPKVIADDLLKQYNEDLDRCESEYKMLLELIKNLYRK